MWVEVSWGDVDGGEATGPFVVPLARSSMPHTCAPSLALACAAPPTVSVGERAGLPLAGSAVAPPRRAERG